MRSCTRRRFVLLGLAVALVALLAVRSRRPAPWETWRPMVVTPPNPNGYDLIVAAAAHATRRPAAPAEQTAAQRAEIVEQNREAVDLLRAALPHPAEGPRFDYRHPAPSAISSVRNLATAVLTRGRWHLEHGQPAEALRCQLDVAELAARISHGHYLLPLVASEAFEAMCLSDAAQTIPALTGPQARDGMARLLRIRSERASLEPVIRGECDTRQDLYTSLLRSGNVTQILASQTDRRPTLSATLVLVLGGKGRVWRQLNDYCQAAIAASRQPLGHQDWPDPARYAPTLAASVVYDWHFLSDREIQLATGMDLWLTALALRACEAEEGHLPDTLDALVPRYLAELPPDVYAGAPPRYRREGGSYVLYSVGADRRDDGGKPIPVRSKVGDMVWGQPLR